MAKGKFRRLEQLAHVSISCAVCLNQGKREPAFTVVNKYAVCEFHVPLVSRPDFDIMSLLPHKKGENA